MSKDDKKKSFVLYNSYIDQFSKLGDTAAGQLIKAIFAYANEQPAPEIEDSGADMAFSFICAQLDRDKEAYEDKCSTNYQNGIKGGRPPKQQQAPVAPKDDRPPTVEEVAAYVHERGSKVDPQYFVDFYASKDWKIGRQKMKDWRAACRTAERWDCWDKIEKQNKEADDEKERTEKMRRNAEQMRLLIAEDEKRQREGYYD